MKKNPRRKICVVTGTRADYGHLYWLLNKLKKDKDICLQIIVTGAHLAPRWGRTVNQIIQDGFKIDRVVEMQLDNDSPIAIAKSVGLGVISFSEAYDQLNPDIVVVLGDRYEILAAAQVAMLMQIPIAHIHGGEVTEGAVDESIRHAVTKFSHIHFVANQVYAKRVRQLGEGEKYIYNYGAPGLDHISNTKLLNRRDLEIFLGFDLSSPFFLVTYHPETLGRKSPKDEIKKLLTAISFFKNAKVVFTGVNADHQNNLISTAIKDYCASNLVNTRYYESLGQVKYLSLMRYANVVIGNSSSGLIEAPAMFIPTVNIGSRQAGRLKAQSVIDCLCETEKICRAIKKALDPKFRALITKKNSLYGSGEATTKILQTLKKVELDGIIQKKFFDC